MIEYVVWDFNGTLLDDMGICQECVNVLLSDLKLPTIQSLDEYRAHFQFPITNYYRSLGIDFDVLPFDKLAVKWVGEYLNRESKASLLPYARETLEILRSKGVKQILFSATEQEMLINQVKRLGIFDYFVDIFGLDNVKAESKMQNGIKMKEKYNLKSNNCVYFGDTDHDFDVAKELDIPCYLIASGHQGYETLSKINKNTYKNTRSLFDSIDEIIYN